MPISTYLQIVEASQLTHYPLNTAQIMRLGQMCRVHSGSRVLELGCGKGELLNQWAKTFDLRGTGVDESDDLIYIAQTRANDLEVWSNVQYVVSEVLDYPQAYHQYNVIAMLSTGVGQDLAQVIDLLKVALRDEGGLLVLSETYWRNSPSAEWCEALQLTPEALPTLGQVHTWIQAGGAELSDMLLVSPEDWDIYYAQQWQAIRSWLREHSEDDIADDLRQTWHSMQRNYLNAEREAIGWGVFVLEIA
jgi:cyclopropane fatty-acyl-phospholipid synthase-like methyltransferase